MSNDNKVAAEETSRLEIKTRPAAAEAATGAELTVDAPSTPAESEEEEYANLGQALRTIYRQTVEEAIPGEMLDLLKRLG
ncbi:MAG: hypothetical protein AB7E05_00885 [Sphingobium sp.]